MQGRRCAICGRPGGVAATLLLKEWGYANCYAHPTCINHERKRRRDRAHNARKPKRSAKRAARVARLPDC